MRFLKVNNNTKYAFLVVLVFFYVYDVNFVFLPFTTNVIWAVLGFGTFIIHIVRNHFIQKKNIFWLAFFIVLLVWCIICTTLNQTDFVFITKELVRNILVPFFGAFFVAYCGRKQLNSVQDVIRTVLIVTVIQSIITFFAFFTSFGDFIRSFQTMNERLTTILDDNIRAYGLGSGFDIGSFIISYSLLITSYFYLLSEKKRRGLYIALYLLQALAGLLMARSIIFGICFSLLFILIANKDILKKLTFLFRIAFVVAVLLGIVLTMFPSLINTYSETIVWLAEILDMESSRTVNAIFDNMYFIPENFKTWIIGDGKYLTASGNPYMNTDPLYMRYLLFFGIPGIVIFILFLITLIFSLKNENTSLYGDSEKARNLYNTFLLFVFILNMTIYVKLNAHSFYLLFYLLWFLHFKYIANKGIENAK